MTLILGVLKKRHTCPGSLLEGWKRPYDRRENGVVEVLVNPTVGIGTSSLK